MTFDTDIFASANELIKQHGEDAPIHAAMRADELLEVGDLDGQAVLRWMSCCLRRFPTTLRSIERVSSLSFYQIE